MSILICIISEDSFLLQTMQQNSHFIGHDLQFVALSDLSNAMTPHLVISTCISIPIRLKDIQNIIIGSDIKAPFHIDALAMLIKDKLSNQRYNIRGLVFNACMRAILDCNDNCILRLTEKESDMIIYLINCGESGANVHDIIKNVWQYSEDVETNTIETHLYRLRQKFASIGHDDIIVIANKRYIVNS